ncbi:helix-turn-helix transcriptional regulator [Luteimonas sp. Y-2-2-4F]|nr:helix-turn-helix transcriptional regulator [Luteimonas sp. Y-2-2-4F]MCD9033120.1 helix-turn-helix transcriptional regulator [Luteimonas sp. Y-2-2-4F]
MDPRHLARRRPELAAFLQQHRRRLRPADAGLPAGGRRRTLGLRREEVAALAGVGLTWYTWFEQGRDIGVSEDFLLRVAKALRLDDDECGHLFLLAHRRPPPPEAYHWPEVAPRVQQLLDELARPAYVINLRWDAVAWNAAADALFGFAGREREARNLLRMVFADPALRRRLPDWEEDAPRLLSHFRCDLAVAPDDPGMRALIEALQALSPQFRRWWAAPPAISGHRRGIGTVEDPQGRRRRFAHELLTVDAHRHLRMIVYFETATDDEPS